MIKGKMIIFYFYLLKYCFNHLKLHDIYFIPKIAHSSSSLQIHFLNPSSNSRY